MRRSLTRSLGRRPGLVQREVQPRHLRGDVQPAALGCGPLLRRARPLSSCHAPLARVQNAACPRASRGTRTPATTGRCAARYHVVTAHFLTLPDSAAGRLRHAAVGASVLPPRGRLRHLLPPLHLRHPGQPRRRAGQELDRRQLRELLHLLLRVQPPPAGARPAQALRPRRDDVRSAVPDAPRPDRRGIPGPLGV